MSVIDRILEALVVTLVLSSAVAGAQTRAPLLMPGKSTLYQRVLTRPGAVLKSDPGTAAAPASQTLPAFSVYYVFDRKVIDDIEWLALGARQSGPSAGWLEAESAVDWKQTLTVAFTNPAGRKPVLLFRDGERLLDLLESETVTREVDALRAAIDRRELDEGFPVISVEPSTYVDFETAFYLLPILSAQEVWLSSGFSTRLLELASVPREQGHEETLRDPAVHERLTRAVPDQASALRDYRAAVAFVVDTTISMQPYIDSVREAIARIYERIEAAGLLRKVSFALVGFRDHVGSTRELGYVSKVFADLRAGEDPRAFLGRVAAVEEAQVSSRGFVEDAYAGIAKALEDLDWNDYGARIIVLVTDAGARRANDPLAQTRMDAEQIRRLALDQRAAIYTLHLLTREGRFNHRSAEAQYQTLSEVPGAGLLYFPVDAGSVEQFRQVVEILAQSLVDQVRDATEGRLADSRGANDQRSVQAATSEPGLTLIDRLEIPADQRGPFTTGVELANGAAHVIEASGAFTIWGQRRGRADIDAVWCFEAEVCRPARSVWNQLTVDGQSLTELASVGRAEAGDPLPFDPGHVYRVELVGGGRPLELAIADSLKGSHRDNSGSLTVRVFRRDSPSSVADSAIARPARATQLEVLQEKTRALGRVMQLAYLGRRTGTRAPRLLRAWAVDRDLDNPDTATLEVRVLLSKNQLSDLQQVLRAIVDAAEAATTPAATGSSDFFNEIRSAAAAMGRDPSRVGREDARNLADTGLLGEYLDDLPYQSKVMSIDEDLWRSWGGDQQQAFIDEIKAKIELYNRYDKSGKFFPLVDGATPGEWVYPIALEALP